MRNASRSSARCQRADANAAVGLERDEAERGQAAERLPDRRAADAVARRQLLLTKDGSRGELPRDDRLLQLERDVVGLGACRLAHGREVYAAAETDVIRRSAQEPTLGASE